MILAALLGGLGLFTMIASGNLLRFLIGTQLLFLGSSVTFVLLGGAPGAHDQILGLFIVLTGVAGLVVGFSISMKYFYLKKDIQMENLNSLKH